MYNWAPGEMLFAMECCGDLPTHRGKLMRFVLRALEDGFFGCYHEETAVLEECGLDREAMTEEDWAFINKEIRARSPSYIN